MGHATYAGYVCCALFRIGLIYTRYTRGVVCVIVPVAAKQRAVMHLMHHGVDLPIAGRLFFIFGTLCRFSLLVLADFESLHEAINLTGCVE